MQVTSYVMLFSCAVVGSNSSESLSAQGSVWWVNHVYVLVSSFIVISSDSGESLCMQGLVR